jgi:hypothetical protein
MKALQDRRKMSNANTNNPIDRKSVLLEKFKQGTINKKDAEELKSILEREKDDASNTGNILLVLGIVILLGFVASYLADMKKFDLDKLRRFLTGTKR